MAERRREVDTVGGQSLGQHGGPGGVVDAAEQFLQLLAPLQIGMDGFLRI